MTERDFITQNIGPSVESSVESRRLLDDPLFREGLLREIHGNSSIDVSGLLRRLLQIEIDYRRDSENGDYFENLYWCAFLLWRIGDLNDVINLWRAKNVNLDTACGFDIQFLVGAGVDETIRYLREKTDTESQAALGYIMECKASGGFDGLQEWASQRSEYFGA